eukprot:5725137-Pleurochrysis_carterae.AAC.5
MRRPCARALAEGGEDGGREDEVLEREEEEHARPALHRDRERVVEEAQVGRPKNRHQGQHPRVRAQTHRRRLLHERDALLRSAPRRAVERDM